MTPIEQIVTNEPIADVLTAFGIGLAYPSLDRMIGRYKFELIASGELLKTYARLFEDGILANGDGPIAVKGPNWKAPKFIAESKYS
ncbi:immunity protein [Pseudomonas granadensis]|uniref:Immunity protein n=1 Tax=Pseudomonas granadensis TaxID=1421430 RepID=A0ABX7GJM2_9PSED|nr:immunity protein [Pseudomonas granadensis]MBN6774687.1 immunity protein [Pseudomonas granadensis]MBN6805513.1 immunity protein [Pseudomonas granadensis]MBN6832713.1 immunity protein [Pseudomonas granadensis]MBN6839707.1 immunity protein [Pseudomonas granadensis]MBN6869082.1 immunity protein [Pseudomonas granadensis]